MREGWYEDLYLVLFEDAAESLEHAYGLADALPGYRLVGLVGWDDFIVRDARGAHHTVPTVPILPQHLKPLAMASVPRSLQPDDRIGGKIKWYLKPIIFGGDPDHGENLTWVTLEEHAQLVRFWNKKYHEVQAGGADPPAA